MKRAPVHRLAKRHRRKPVDHRPSPSVRGYDHNWRKVRKMILARDFYLCRTCGEPVGHSGHVDHIVPLRDGGQNSPDNLQTLCASCHSRKTVRGG